MKPKGFIPIALAIIIGIIAVAVTCVGIYYKVASDKEDDETENTNQVVVNTNTVNQNANTDLNVNTTANSNLKTSTKTAFSSCTEGCKEYHFQKGTCQTFGSTLDSLQFQEENADKILSLLVGSRITVTGCSLSSDGAWEDCLCLN